MIAKPVLIGRNYECEKLKETLTSGRAEYVILCGRKGIGKTSLVNYAFENKYDFLFTGQYGANTRTHLSNFAKTLQKYSKQHQEPFADWFDAFDALEDYLEALPKDEKKVVFLDEMQWIYSQRSSFISGLEIFWNGWGDRRDDVVLIVAGSATAWMYEKIIGNIGGLYNRSTRRIFLEPFTLAETEEYFTIRNASFTRYDILQIYMFTGGIPYYLSLIDTELSVAQNIKLLCFIGNAPLRREYEELYEPVFSHAKPYLKVMELLCEHEEGMTRKEIFNSANINGKFLNTILKRLEVCDFIDRYALFGKKRKSVYRLADLCTLFYLKLVRGRNITDTETWTHDIDDDVKSWMGFAFKIVCMHHHSQIKKALGISGIGTAVSTWKCDPDNEERTPAAQIDMLIERADKVVHLFEMIFCEDEFEISHDYEMSLRERMGIFEWKTRTKDAMLHTFVTPHGLGACRVHSIVHSQLTMNDLFDAG